MSDPLAKPILTETADERRRRLARERKRRQRERTRPGDKLVLLPADVVDELGDDENVAARAIAILRRYLVKSVRDGA